MLYIQELCHFGYTPLSVSLRHFLLFPYVCIKILSILKRKNSGLIPHRKLENEYELKRFKAYTVYPRVMPF